MSNLEDRFQAIMLKSNQIEADKKLREKVSNDLININDALKDVAGRIEETIRSLVFMDLDGFLGGQNFQSEVNAGSGRDYKFSDKKVEWTQTSAASRKIAFLVKQNIIESRDYRVEVSFKEQVFDSGMRTATQGIAIRSNQSTEELLDWLRNLEATKQKLDTQLAQLSLSDITFEVCLVGSNRSTKKVNTPTEAMLAILEN